jgi:hypothetical protein
MALLGLAQPTHSRLRSDRGHAPEQPGRGAARATPQRSHSRRTQPRERRRFHSSAESRPRPARSVEQGGDLLARPDVIGQPCRHRRGPRVRVGKALVGPREVHVHEVERHGGGVFSTFFEKPLVRRVKRRIPIRIVSFGRRYGSRLVPAPITRSCHRRAYSEALTRGSGSSTSSSKGGVLCGFRPGVFRGMSLSMVRCLG